MTSCKDFDGTSFDSFDGTSLHLSFTNYHVPVFLSDSSGLQDSQVSVLEAVISVQDSGSWVGDVAIPDAVTSPHVLHWEQNTCAHEPGKSLRTSEITSVGSWDDILDCPAGTIMVHSIVIG